MGAGERQSGAEDGLEAAAAVAVVSEDEGASPSFSVDMVLDRFVEAVSELTLEPSREGPLRLALGVSGGSDSRALLELAALARHRFEFSPTCLTVDHGLRPESAREAEAVAARCAALGVPHATLRWEGPRPSANVAAAARDARYRLMRAWRRQNHVPTLAVAHTADDVAETFLMRLARGSGVDGLAAMAARRDDHPGEHERGLETEPEAGAPRLRLIRPLLEVSRADLRRVCAALGADWVDDPTNDDLRFDRPKARRALAALAPLGLTRDRLVKTALRMRQARDALQVDAARLLGATVRWDRTIGWARIAVEPLRAAPREIALRGLAETLRAVAAAPYRPRLAKLEAALDAILDADDRLGRTLHGCVVERVDATAVAISREPAACDGVLALEPGRAHLWDGRFRVRVARRGLCARALLADSRTALSRSGAGSDPTRDAPAPARAAACGVFDGEALIATPFAPVATPDIEIGFRPQPHNLALTSTIELIGNGQRLS